MMYSKLLSTNTVECTVDMPFPVKLICAMQQMVCTLHYCTAMFLIHPPTNW